MSKHSEERNRRAYRSLLIFVAGVAGVAALSYFGRGWIRKTAVPAVATVTYGNSVEKTAQAELAKLGDPLKTLGFDKVEVLTNKCALAGAHNFSEQLNCTYNLNAFREVSQTEADKAELNAKAAAIQTLLKANGWDGVFVNDTDSTSLVKLVTNINKGIDYTPDASYTKTIGKVTCSFSSTTAFSTPKPAAFSSHFTCWRDLGLFTKPVTGFEM